MLPTQDARDTVARPSPLLHIDARGQCAHPPAEQREFSFSCIAFFGRSTRFARDPSDRLYRVRLFCSTFWKRKQCYRSAAHYGALLALLLSFLLRLPFSYSNFCYTPFPYSSSLIHISCYPRAMVSMPSQCAKSETAAPNEMIKHRGRFIYINK